MGLIQATPGELSTVGSQIESVAPSIAGLAGVARGLGSDVSDPPATAAALQGLAGTWSGAIARLEDDVTALGVAVQASAVAYRVTDQTAIGGGGP